MIKIDKNKCIKCGSCIKDCFNDNLAFDENGDVFVKSARCILCAHCVAVCPKDAVSIDDYPADGIEEIAEDKRKVEAENLLNLMRFSRTVRQFKDKAIEKEKLDMLIAAAYSTPTAGNRQTNVYAVVTEGIDELRTLCAESLKLMSDDVKANPDNYSKIVKVYAAKWEGIYKDVVEDGAERDGLFFHAPLVFVIGTHPDQALDAGLVAARVEMMADALGLGVLHSGFFVRASSGSAKIKEFLGFNDKTAIKSCLVIGYPAVKYVRTVPRKPVDVIYK
ncbi:MAG: nitroreductase family protein [Firmicutes bacterium]|nr:nitroreductase family protein [Bacillota bacterium]